MLSAIVCLTLQRAVPSPDRKQFFSVKIKARRFSGWTRVSRRCYSYKMKKAPVKGAFFIFISAKSGLYRSHLLHHDGLAYLLDTRLFQSRGQHPPPGPLEYLGHEPVVEGMA